jgi:hypothetical protein
MNRTPPREVRDALAREVNYGCPVQGCGCPFLKWHHFDPPWKVKEHHDPAGMIALCPTHAERADGGVFTANQLQSMKTSPYVRDRLRAPWPWEPEKLLFVLGGSVILGAGPVLSVSGRTVLQARPGQLPGARCQALVFDISLTDPQERPILEVVQNQLSADVQDSRIRTSARTNRFAIDHDSGVSLQLEYRRYTPTKLRERLRDLLEDQQLLEYAADRASREALDSDGLVPVVSVRGHLLTADWDLKMARKRTRLTAKFYPGPPAELTPMVFGDGGSLAIVYEGQTLLAFG